MHDLYFIPAVVAAGWIHYSEQLAATLADLQQVAAFEAAEFYFNAGPDDLADYLEA